MESHWKRTYWVVWTANLITSIGMMSFLPFFPSLLEEMGVEGEASISRWAGVCFAAAPLSATVSAPLWGAIGDRFGRKVMVCRAMLAIAVAVSRLVRSHQRALVVELRPQLDDGFVDLRERKHPVAVEIEAREQLVPLRPVGHGELRLLPASRRAIARRCECGTAHSDPEGGHT